MPIFCLANLLESELDSLLDSELESLLELLELESLLRNEEVTSNDIFDLHKKMTFLTN